MPKKARRKTAKEVENLTAAGFHAVGGVDGLYLRVTNSGARSWVLRYATPELKCSKNGTPYYARRDLGLGGYPDVTLSQAREKAREYREQIRHGVDPAAQRAEARRQWAESLRRGITFYDAAWRAYEAKAPEYRDESHRKTFIGRLEKYAFPVIGHIPVADIGKPEVLSVIEPIWTEKPETANRVRNRIETVLTWSKVAGYREGDNPAAWRDNLDRLLPNPKKIRKKEHFPALPWHRVPSFMGALRQREGFSARALEFLILTAARSGEVRLAQWSEIDLKARTWTIPADRMKAEKAHIVPLSDDAVALLESMPRLADEPHVFPANRGGPQSNMALTSVLKRMDNDNPETWIDPENGRRITVHGFRSSFKDWARSRTSYPDEVSELQLAHVNSDATRAAYARDGLLPQRARLMADWAQFVREGLPEGAEVSAIGEHARAE